MKSDAGYVGFRGSGHRSLWFYLNTPTSIVCSYLIIL